MPQSDQRSVYIETLDNSAKRGRQIVDPLDDGQFNWKPTANAWSVGECLDHLNRVARGYVPAMEEVVETADLRNEGSYRYGWISRKFIDSLAPGTRPLKTAGAMKPAPVDGSRSQLNKDETITEFLALTARYVEIIRRSEGLDLAGVKMRSPFLWLLRLPIGAFMEALGQHAHRHLDQAERVVAHPSFPSTHG